MEESVRKHRQEVAEREHQDRQSRAKYKADKAAGKAGCLIVIIGTGVLLLGLKGIIFAML